MLPSGSSNLLLAAVLINTGVAAAKLIVAAMTGSGAVLAEFIHSIATTTSLALLLIAIRWATGAANARAAHNSESELRFWCLVVPIMIYSLAAGVALNESMVWLQTPRQLTELPTGLAILAAALTVQTALALVIGRRIRIAGDADRDVLQMLEVESLAAVAGIGTALAGLAAAYAFGTVESDALAALTVGLILGGVAAMMAVATRKHLKDSDARGAPAASIGQAPPTIIARLETPPDGEPPRKNRPLQREGRRKRR
jgi:divalent metal cation (Fe/Co/Zn/Cd) transporter